VSPEALGGGPLAYVRDGDVIRFSAEDGTLSTTADLSRREPAQPPEPEWGTGRELFGMFRDGADEAERGGSAMLAMGGL
jgi:phosphogluconate dehydratase